MNLVNFVRGCEPRKQNWDLYTPVVEEIAINRAAGFRSTFLLQHDAMLREDFRTLFLKERGEDLELGVWLEMGRPLTEAVGIEWRGRPGYDWDWYVNPGFLPAYTLSQREALIDEVFRLFREIFGSYPRVAGSWLLDAHSMEYMSDKYGMDAFVICREQYAVDAYTLWGGYYSGGYYPSRSNMLCPAQHEQTQINTPVFRMLGIDPIYGYDEEKHNPRLGGCYTMEPFWPSGKNREVMEWYLDSYYTNPALSGSYATTGQENSFDWRLVKEGYQLQIDLLRHYEREGKLCVETLGETGRSFKKRFETTPASALSAFTDWSEQGIQSVWFSSRNYRANLFLKNGQLIFRDLQKFDDSVEEEHLKTPCTAWQACYGNLPIMDNRMWSTSEKEASLAFDSPVASIEADDASNDHTLVLQLRFADGKAGKIFFDEERIVIQSCGSLTYCIGKGEVLQSVKTNEILFYDRNTSYALKTDARITAKQDEILFAPSREDMELRF